MFTFSQGWESPTSPQVGDLPNPGIKPRCLALQAIIYQLSHKGSPSQRKAMTKNVQTSAQLHSFHMSKQGNAQNPPSKASTIHEPRTSRCISWIKKRQRSQRSNCQHPVDDRKKQENSRKTSTSASLTMLKTVWITTNCGKFLKRWEYQTT